MGTPISKKALYEMRYPKGTIVELTEPIEDEPARGSLAIIIEKDKFKIVG